MSAIDPNAKSSRIVGTISGNLWLEPNGIYRLDGWVVPVGHDATFGVDDRQLVEGQHNAVHNGVSLSGSVLGVNIPE